MENKNEWKKVKLGEIVTITMGQSPKSEFYNLVGEGVPFLQGNRTFGKKFPSFDTYTTKVTKIAKKNDVIMSVRAPIGDLNLATTDICLGRGVCSLRMNNGNYEFLFYLLKYYSKQLINNGNGTVFTSINRNEIYNLEINIPNNEFIQKKISKILSDIDNKIELNNKINNNLEILIFLIYQKIFLNNNFSQRKLCKMEEYFNISIGKTPPRKNKECFSNNSNDNIWVSILDMKSSGIYIDKSSEYLTSEAIKKYNVKVIPKNTLLLSFKLTIGRIAITCQDRTTTNEAIAHFLSDKKGATEYLYCYLKNFNFNTLGSTSSIATAINSKIIKEITFVIPEEDELNEFYNLVNPLFKKIRAFQLENIKLTNLKNYLLPKLMNGEIDIEKIEL